MIRVPFVTEEIGGGKWRLVLEDGGLGQARIMLEGLTWVVASIALTESGRLGEFGVDLAAAASATAPFVFDRDLARFRLHGEVAEYLRLNPDSGMVSKPPAATPYGAMVTRQRPPVTREQAIAACRRVMGEEAFQPAEWVIATIMEACK